MISSDINKERSPHRGPLYTPKASTAEINAQWKELMCGKNKPKRNKS